MFIDRNGRYTKTEMAKRISQLEAQLKRLEGRTRLNSDNPTDLVNGDQTAGNDEGVLEVPSRSPARFSINEASSQSPINIDTSEYIRYYQL